MNLNAITVELDLVYPAVAPRHLLDGGSERRFDEAGERSLDTDGCRFLALERHVSDQADRQRQLNVVVTALVSVDEILQADRDVAHLKIAAVAQFMGNVGRDVLRPSFGGVEADDADRVLVLTGQKIGDDGFKVGSSRSAPALRATGAG
jgi:hypothetical protein